MFIYRNYTPIENEDNYRLNFWRPDYPSYNYDKAISELKTLGFSDSEIDVIARARMFADQNKTTADVEYEKYLQNQANMAQMYNLVSAQALFGTIRTSNTLPYVPEPDKFEGFNLGSIPKVLLPGDDDFIGPLSPADNHFIYGDGIGPKQRGVLGAHNGNYFKRILQNTGFSLDDLLIGDPKPHPTINGVYSQKYTVPAYDSWGKFIGFKNIKDPKTFYDPNIISDSQMLQWGKEAMSSGVITDRIIEGTASNGLLFRGYIENGVVTNFFPVVP